MQTVKRFFFVLCLVSGMAWGGTLRNPAANRWRQWRGVDNVRDFGGMTTVDGHVVRTNMIYRSQAFNDNAVCDWLTGARLKAKYESLLLYVEFGRRNSDELVEQIDKTDIEGSCKKIAAAIRADKSKWRIGEPRGTPESRRRILLETGLKTEIDLRSESECYGMTGSPLGDSVAWVHLPGDSSLDWYQTEDGKRFFSRCFKLFLEPGNYPIDFHCIGGADRTGSLAFVLGAILGVTEAELIEDYTMTSFSTSGKRSSDKMRKGMNAFDGYPGVTINDRVCAYARACGFAQDDIRKFRSIVLADPAAPAKRAAFAEENVTRYADISKDEARQVVVAPGTTNVYNGHATVVRTKTGKMIAVWTIGHGGACGPSAESTDGGKTWTRIDDRFPDAWKKTRNCPAVFSLGERNGKERLMVFSCGDYDMEQQRSVAMTHCVSEDDGLTWKMLDPIPVTCVMPLTTLVVLKSGELLGLYNDRWPELQKRLTAERGKQTWWNRVFQIRSRDGGMTWSAPEKVAASETLNLCEPFVLRSDDGQELCCIMRDNGGSRSQLAFSRDEGRTWSAPEPSSAALTGHRHHGVRDSKGRWTIAFRDVDSESPYRNHFCCWRGTYDDIVKRNDREKIKLLHSRAGRDCGYAACVLLPGDEVMAFTYIKYRKGPEKHSVVGVSIPDQLP